MAVPAPLTGAGRVAGAAALIAVLTVASRLAGFGRVGVFTWVLPTDLGGVYVLANTVPNIIFEIVAGGALASLVVPLLAGPIAAGDRVAVSATTAALLTWTVSLLVPLAVLVAVFADPIIALLSDDFSAAQIATGAGMLRIFSPQLPLYGVGIVLTGVLQAYRRFAWPVIAPLLSSLTVIGVYLVFAATEGRGVRVAEVSRAGELILSVGTTLGVAVLSLCLLIPLRSLRLRLRPTYGFTAEARGLVRGLALAGAATVVGQQVALMVTLRLVSGSSTGAEAIVPYNLAQTIYLLPWAVLAVPLAVAAYPTLAAARVTGDSAAFQHTLAPTVRATLLLSCLGAAALVAVAGPVARFFFDGVGVGQAAAGIVGFAPGLIGYGLFAVLSRALYARGDTRVAAGTTVAGWLVVPVIAVVLAVGLPETHRVLAVTLANSVGMTALGALLLTVVARRAGRAALAGSVRATCVGLLAATVAAGAGTALARWLPVMLDHTPSAMDALFQGMLSGAVVGAIFLAIAYPLDRHDLRPLTVRSVHRLRRMIRRFGDRKETVSR